MEQEKVTKLCSVNNSMEAEMVLDILKQHNIPAYKKGISSAEFLKLYTGQSPLGEDIFVNEKDAEQAKGLIVDIVNEETAGAGTERSKKQQVLGIVIMVIFALVLIYGLYSSF